MPEITLRSCQTVLYAGYRTGPSSFDGKRATITPIEDMVPSKCLTADTQYEILISLSLSHYWEWQISVISVCLSTKLGAPTHESSFTESITIVHANALLST